MHGEHGAQLEVALIGGVVRHLPHPGQRRFRDDDLGLEVERLETHDRLVVLGCEAQDEIVGVEGGAGIDGRRSAVAVGVPRASHGVVAHGLDGSMIGPARSYAPSSGISVESEILQR